MQVHAGTSMNVIHFEVWVDLASEDLIQGERFVCSELCNHHTW